MPFGNNNEDELHAMVISLTDRQTCDSITQMIHTRKYVKEDEYSPEKNVRKLT